MIVIDASPAVHRKAGLGRYAEELIAALRQRRPSRYAAFYHDAATAQASASIKALPQLATAQKPYPWRLRALVGQLLNLSQDSLFAQPFEGGQRAELFHATEHLLPRLKRVPSVFTLHDLIFKFYPKYHLPRNWIFLQLAMPLFLRRANAVICVSERTRADAARIYGLRPEKTHVIHEGIDPAFKRVVDLPKLQDVRARHKLPERFFLAVGTIEPRKNLAVAFEALKNLKDADDVQLIVVGKQGWLFEETFRAVHERGLTGRVRFLGYTEDGDLPALYSLARALVFPSVYEGFGFPPLEAMACGAAVLSADNSSLPEICGDAAVLLPALNASSWVAPMQRVLDDAEFRRGLAGRGPAQAAKFTWSKAAEQTERVYDELLAR